MEVRNLLRWAVLGLGAVAAIALIRRRPDRRPPLAADPELDARLDRALEETFPASDPIAVGRIE